MVLLRFGANSSVELKFADGVVPDEYGQSRGEPLADLAASVTAALNDPIDYPALALCTTPADRVVVVMDPATPRVAEVTKAAVDALLAAGIAPDGVTILRNCAKHDDATGGPCRLIDDSLRRRMTELVHDPADRQQLAYLAADDDGDPILVNRALHEADFVLPIGCLDDDRAAGYFGIHGSIFPAFSDTNTLHRFRCLGSLDANHRIKRALAKQVENVAWLLGIHFTMQIVSAAGGQALHVLAGQCEAVRRQGRTLQEAAWRSAASRRTALVVAAVEGGPAQQTWQSLARAIENAGQLADEGGVIAVCCELSDPPGPAMQQLASADSRQAALRHIGKDRPIDALAAAQIAHVLDRNEVFLLSRLDPSLVEDLDMAPIADLDELVRLTQRCRSCAVLANAAYASVACEEH